MDITSALKTIGFTKSETAVYLFLLQYGAATPPQIAKGTAIARTNCYNILQSLKEKGVVAEQQAGKRRRYLAHDPQAFLANLDRRRETLEQLLPDLRALYGKQKNKPVIRFYEGFDEVKELYALTFETKDKLRALGSIESLGEVDQDFFVHYHKELKRRGIVLSDILTYASREKGAKETKAILGALYDFKFLPAKYADVPTDMLIWDDNIAVITLEEPIFGTVITSPLIARTFKVIFDVLSERLS